jgi:hypothetical protein
VWRWCGSGLGHLVGVVQGLDEGGLQLGQERSQQDATLVDDDAQGGQDGALDLLKNTA